jgi:small ligand-binding sensory domain FIST
MITAAVAIGVSIAGDVDLQCVVSQGCRPIGRTLVITRAQRNRVLELGGRPAMAALEEMAATLDERERDLLGKGLLMGTVIDERNRPFGRGDFLVRNLLGVDKDAGAILVGDLPRVGQTVQFHARDAITAAEDLQLLLDAEELKERPFAALLFTCNGRGRRLFGAPDHDVRIIDDRLGPLPMAGFFAAGEIGPVGARSFLHGHTAALALFRAVA